MTNGDKIRAMSDDKLARLLRQFGLCLACPGKILGVPGCPYSDIGITDCQKCVKHYLKQEAKDE